MAAKLTISINEQGQLALEAPTDMGLSLQLLAGAHEILMRRWMPQQPTSPSGIVVPNLVLPNGPPRQ